MRGTTTTANVLPIGSRTEFIDELTVILRKGAREMLQAAIEAEVKDYIELHRACLDENGHRQVVRNRHHPERSIQTGVGPLDIRKPKVNDKRVDENGERVRFQSTILPSYLKRTKSVEELVPWLY